MNQRHDQAGGGVRPGTGDAAEPEEPMTPASASADRSDGPETGEEIEHSAPSLIFRFFVVPFLIIAGSVALFLLVFHLLTSEGKKAADYLEEVRTGHFNRRWQAAFELSRHLAADPPEDREPLARSMVQALEEAADDDPRVRRYLVTAMGQLGEPLVVPVLIEALDDPDPDTRFQAILSLGEIGDTRAVEPLIAQLDDPDPGVRIAAAGMLGALGDVQAAEALESALADPREDVRWNAAIALSRLGKLSAVGQLRKMLDRTYLARVPDATRAQQEAAMREAIAALVRLEAREAREDLERLSRADPDPQIRMEAGEGVEALRGSS